MDKRNHYQLVIFFLVLSLMGIINSDLSHGRTNEGERLVNAINYTLSEAEIDVDLRYINDDINSLFGDMEIIINKTISNDVDHLEISLKMINGVDSHIKTLDINAKDYCVEVGDINPLVDGIKGEKHEVIDVLENTDKPIKIMASKYEMIINGDEIKEVVGNLMPSDELTKYLTRQHKIKLEFYIDREGLIRKLRGEIMSNSGGKGVEISINKR